MKLRQNVTRSAMCTYVDKRYSQREDWVVKMYPYYFVAILGSDSEGDWAVLTGRSDGPVSREACQNGHLRLSPAHPIHKAAGKARQKKTEKGVLK